MRKRTCMLTAMLLSGMMGVTSCGTFSDSTGTAAAGNSGQNSQDEAVADSSADNSAMAAENAGAATAAAAEADTDPSNPKTNGLAGLFLTDADIQLKKSDAYTEYTESAHTLLALDGSSAQVSGAQKSAVSVAEGEITITAEGTYVLSGDFKGTVAVDAPEDAKVVLVLNNASVTSEGAPAIYAKQADKVTLSLPAGTENTVADSVQRSDETLDAAIYAETDLVCNGTGALTVEGNCKDAIHGKDDVRICEGSYTLTAADDALVGKDRLEIQGGSFTVKAGGKGLKATNEEDADKGFIAIGGGSFNIEAEDDGLHAASAVWITGGDLRIAAGDDGVHADETLTVDGGSLCVTESCEALEAPEIVLNGGDIDLTATDDGINAAGGNAQTEETDGEKPATPPSGSAPAEGTDGEKPAAPPSGSAPTDGTDGEKPAAPPSGSAPTDGTDGEKPAAPPSGSAPTDGTDGEKPAMPPGGSGMGGPAESSEGYLYINGGAITVRADGDGLDANTSIYQTGGDVVVEGPTGDGNGALDYAEKYIMTGGTLFASGSAGMLQSISEGSTVQSLTVVFDAQQAAGTAYTIKDSSGETLYTSTPSKAYAAVTYAGADLQSDAAYQIYSGDTKLCEVTLSKVNQVITQTGEETAAGIGGMRDEPEANASGSSAVCMKWRRRQPSASFAF